MRPLALVPLLLAALAAAAEPLRGIPPDVDVALRVSYDTAGKSQLAPVMRAMQTRMEAIAARTDPAAAKANKDIQARLGLSPERNHQLDLGVRVRLVDGEPGFEGFVVFRLDAKKDALDAFARETKASPVTFAGGTAWELSGLVSAVRGANAGALPGGPEPFLSGHALLMPEDGVMIIAPIRELALAMACWNGKTPSLRLAAPVEAAADGTPLCHTTASVEVGKLARLLPDEATEPGAPASPPAGGMTRAALVVGEDASHVLARAALAYGDAAQAKAAADQIRAFIPIGNLMAMPTEEDDAAAKEMKAQAGRFLASLAVEQTGTEVRIVAKHRIEDVKQLLARVESDLANTLAASAPSAGPTTPTPPEIKARPDSEPKKGR